MTLTKKKRKRDGGILLEFSVNELGQVGVSFETTEQPLFISLSYLDILVVNGLATGT